VHKSFFLILALLLISVSGAAKTEHVCLKDDRILCDGVGLIEGNDFQCLYEKYKQLSKGCQAFINSTFANRPCFQDSIQFCSPGELAGTKVIGCLQKNESKLIAKCKLWIAKSRAKGAKIEEQVKAACSSEWQICSNPDFRKQAMCMENLRAANKMTPTCTKVFTEARARKK
jgi:hypothetical protein